MTAGRGPVGMQARPAPRLPRTRRPSACRRRAASGTASSATPRTGWRRPRRPRRRLARRPRSAARGRRTEIGQSSTRAPSTGPRSVRKRKSSSRNRGSLASACTPPPPTVDGRLLTSPVRRRSPSLAERRYVRGSSSGSGPSRWRRVIASSSLAKWRRGACGGARSSRWLRPFSSTMTDQPASVSTSATVAPPGPEPMMRASQSVIRRRAPAGRSARGRRCAASHRWLGCRRRQGRRRWPRWRGCGGRGRPPRSAEPATTRS